MSVVNRNKNKNAQIIWNYMNNSSELKKADLIWVLCSYNTDLAELAAQLYKDGYGSKILFSGAFGKGKSHYFSEPEARFFATRAHELGVPKEDIFIDDMATNTGESILLGYKQISKLKNKITNIILIQKPYKLRASFNSILAQYPEVIASNIIPYTVDTDMDIYFDEHDNNKTINSMVGELYKIINYPKANLMIEDKVPDAVLTAYRYFITQGFTSDIPKPKTPTKKIKSKIIKKKKTIKKATKIVTSKLPPFEKLK
jgi:uncharacterized SAM-binding protein YcdF (DUF218 family)